VALIYISVEYCGSVTWVKDRRSRWWVLWGIAHLCFLVRSPGRFCFLFDTTLLFIFCARNLPWFFTVINNGIFLFLLGSDWVSWHCGHYWPIVPAPDDRWWWLWWNWWNEDWQGKPKYSEKTWPSTSLSTTNPTWPDPGLNPGRRCGKPATNRLGYGAAVK
jgi:hypothetical protein